MKVVLKVVKGPHTGRLFEFSQHDTFIVGRAKTSQFRLTEDDLFFSRNHFLIEVNPPLCRLMDLNSRNGSFVNGKRVSKIDLKAGDVIKGGKTWIQVAVEMDSSIEVVESPRVITDVTIVPQNWSQVRERIDLTSNSTMDDGKKKKLVPSQNSTSEPITAITESLPVFSGYRTLRVLGRGGMGTVYEATSLEDGTKVAIKVVNINESATEKDLARFVREAQILKELTHPHIVGFQDMQKNEHLLFIVMDYVAGRNADLVLKESAEPISVTRAVNWMTQLLDALEYSHSLGYVHRDVKPTNLLIEKQGTIEKLFLADFGLSRTYQSSKLSGLTMTGEIGGSTPFMPPEQITSYREVEPAADQYSAAATLYYLLTNHSPYDLPRDVAKQLLMILQQSPIPIEDRNVDLPKELALVIHRALSRDPRDRFRDVREFRQALNDAVPIS